MDGDELIEFEKMKEAYGRLFLLENGLRNCIEEEMKNAYGQNWYYNASFIILKRRPKKEFHQHNLHELERCYLNTYQKAFNRLPKKFFYALHTVYPLRNKIAHSHKLSENEYRQLETSTSLIFSYLYPES